MADMLDLDQPAPRLQHINPFVFFRTVAIRPGITNIPYAPLTLACGKLILPWEGQSYSVRRQSLSVGRMFVLECWKQF